MTFPLISRSGGFGRPVLALLVVWTLSCGGQKAPPANVFQGLILHLGAPANLQVERYRVFGALLGGSAQPGLLGEATAASGELRPSLSPGRYLITVDGLDGSGATVAEGGSVAEVPAGGHAELTITLTAVEPNTTPRVTDGLQVLYRFGEGAGTAITDASGVGSPLNLELADAAAATWTAGALSIQTATIAASAGPATKLVDACRASNEITIEAWLTPANTGQAGPARIVSVSQDPYLRNFTLGQDGAAFIVRLRTTETSPNGLPAISTPVGAVRTQLTHIAYTRDAAGTTKVFIDGSESASGTVGGDLSSWDGTYALALANELTRDRPWLGEVHLVALYSRALSPEEIGQNFQAGPEETGLPNSPPVVEAGPGRTIEPGGTATLEGRVTDDGLPDPPGNVWISWSFVSGPGTVAFADDTAAATTATFSAEGTYVLRLTATDGELSASDDVTIVVRVAPSGGGVVRFVHRIIDADPPESPHCKAVGDIDGDGYPDLLAASSANQGLHWYAYPSWSKHQIAPGTFTTDMQVADIDGDGDLDAVIPRGDGLYWYENPRPGGDPTVGPWTSHLIGAAGANAHDVEVGDFDKDGRVDVVSRRKGGNGTYLWLQDTPTSWTQITVSTRAGEGVALGDIDGDGDLDIAGGGFWIETPSDVRNGTWTHHDFDSNWPPEVGVHIADINGDGKLDVVLAPSERAEGRLSWYEASDPKAGPWTEHIVDDTVSYLHTFKSADVNNDGYLDLVTAEMHQSSDPDEVSVYFNQGGGLAWTQQVIATTGSHNIRVVDIGNDGDIDIFGANWNVAAPNGAVIELWENQLNDVQPLNQWTRHVIDPDRPWKAVLIAAGDLDGDGDVDVVTGGWWYENPGSPGGTWTRHELGAPLYNMAAVHDFDGDGNLDVLGTDGKVDGANFAWARNDGAGSFTVLTNIERGDGDFLQGVAVGHFQSGGPLEVALSWHGAGRGVQMLTLPADPSTETWGWRKISDTSQDEALSAGDIDRDGDLDLLLGTRWLLNQGATWEAHILSDVAGSPDRNRLVDINGDGRLDAVVGFEAISVPGKLAWYEQPPSPTDPWTEHVIATLVGPMSLRVIDMDRDGDPDVVVGEHNLAYPAEARLVIFENTDGAGGAWTEHVVYTGDEHHDGAYVVDIDGDGDLDILSIGWGHNRVLLYENLAVP